MVSTISAISLLIVSVLLVSSASGVELPGNYTLPKTGLNLCFIARFNLSLNVEYLKIDGKKTTTRIPLNNQTFDSYEGSCLSSANNHTLTLNMLGGLTSISFEFAMDGKNQTSLSKASVSLTINKDSVEYFGNHSQNVEGLHVFLANESLFSTDRAHSYRCNSKTTIDNFKGKENVTITSIVLEDLRIQPFVDNTVVFNDYAAEKVCTMDYIRNSNLIPIIVGVCLAVLVVIVLVAYLVGRRRNRNGYQSV